MNCIRISRFRAPIARLSPISDVRSRTDASMMFMIPMPPTALDGVPKQSRDCEGAGECLRSFTVAALKNRIDQSLRYS
jgi:hypothetical protein